MLSLLERCFRFLFVYFPYSNPSLLSKLDFLLRFHESFCILVMYAPKLQVISSSLTFQSYFRFSANWKIIFGIKYCPQLRFNISLIYQCEDCNMFSVCKNAEKKGQNSQSLQCQALSACESRKKDCSN